MFLEDGSEWQGITPNFKDSVSVTAIYPSLPLKMSAEISAESLPKLFDVWERSCHGSQTRETLLCQGATDDALHSIIKPREALGVLTRRFDTFKNG